MFVEPVPSLLDETASLFTEPRDSVPERGRGPPFGRSAVAPPSLTEVEPVPAFAAALASLLTDERVAGAEAPAPIPPAAELPVIDDMPLEPEVPLPEDMPPEVPEPEVMPPEPDICAEANEASIASKAPAATVF